MEAGATKEILTRLASMFNFTIEYVPGFDGEWNKDGVAQYFGSEIGFTFHNYCDISAGSYNFYKVRVKREYLIFFFVFEDAHATTMERTQFVDFTHTFYETAAYMAVGRQPSQEFFSFYSKVLFVSMR